MRAKAIEIRWHNTKPIYSTDFQLSPPSNLDILLPNKAHPYTKSDHDKQIESFEADSGCGNVWRLATAGGDNLVMIWLVYPKPTMAQLAHHRSVYQQLSGQASGPTTHPKSAQDPKHINAPIVEYLATLAKHQGVVNVVRFCPKGEMLASAGDDGNVLLWVLSTNSAPAVAFGESAADKIYERESWRTRLMLRGPAQCEIYDLAWSPCGDFLLTGDTAKTARIWNVTDGSCIKQIAEHSNFVQGVAWDPLGKYIATQSSDRSMNIYSVQINRDRSGAATADVHHIGKNYKIDLLNNQTSTWASYQVQQHNDKQHTDKQHTDKQHNDKQDTQHNDKSNPTALGARVPPPSVPLESLPSNTAPSSTASSVVTASQTGRPKLDSRSVSALTSLSDGPSSHTSHPLGSTNRILSIPPTPSTTTSTQFNEDSIMQPPAEIPHHTSANSMQNLRNHSRSRQSSVVSSQTMSPSLRPIRSPSPVPPLPAIHVNEEKRTSSVLLYGDEGASAFFRRLAWSVDGSMLLTPAGRWEGCSFGEEERKTKGKGKEGEGGVKRRRKRKSTAAAQPGVDSDDDCEREERKEEAGPTVFIYGRGAISASAGKGQRTHDPLARLPGHKTSSIAIRFSPVVYALNRIRPGSVRERRAAKVELAQGAPMQEVELAHAGVPDETDLPPEVSEDHAGVFGLAYRMVYAVATHDTVFVYDTQQASPICLFSNLHFSSFTDLAWTMDGEGLILSSSDGYCSLVSFDRHELGRPLSKEETARFLPNRPSVDEGEISIVEREINEMTGQTPVGLMAVGVAALEGSVEGVNSKESTSEPVSVSTTEVVPQNHGDGGPAPKKKRVALTYEGPVPR